MLHFRLVLVVFGQSQCSGSAGQSEQTALVGRRDFVENDLFERLQFLTEPFKGHCGGKNSG